MSSATTEENQSEYLLDYKQFQKFYELLKPRSNVNFINKIQEKQLMYSTKYFPISHSELENIKSHLRERLNEKLTLENNEKEKEPKEFFMEKSEEAEQSQGEGAEQSQGEGANQEQQQQQYPQQQRRVEGINQEEKKTEKTPTFAWRPTKWHSFKVSSKRK